MDGVEATCAIRRQSVDGRDYSFTYSYALNDALTSVRYPSGRIITYSLDGAGRTTSAAGNMTGSDVVPYASGVKYAPHGALSEMTLNNGLIERWKYTPRLQVSNVHLGTGADGTPAAYNRMGLSYGYYADGSPSSHGIQRAEGSWAHAFVYDSVGRLKSAAETVNGAQSWRQSFDYDRWGNRWFDSACGGGTCNHGFILDPLSATAAGHYDSVTNRLTKAGLTAYMDGVGNQTKMGAFDLKYDEEGRLKESKAGATVTAYQYDGEGRRVKKTTGTNWTVYVYTAHGELAAEVKTGPSQAQPVRYLAVDALGSTRAVTDAAGVVTRCDDFHPFGEPVGADVERSGRGAFA